MLTWLVCRRVSSWCLGRRNHTWAEETLSCGVVPTEAMGNPVGISEAGMTLQSYATQVGMLTGYFRHNLSNIHTEWTSGLRMLTAGWIYCGLRAVLFHCLGFTGSILGSQAHPQGGLCVDHSASSRAALSISGAAAARTRNLHSETSCVLFVHEIR